MTAADRVAAVVREWVAKAENDLKNAAHTLELGTDCPTDTVCFHAQQCVQKYVKALLTNLAVDPPRTHDIEELVARLPEEAAVNLSVEEQRRLTDYATVTRYPGDYEPITLGEARKAVSTEEQHREAALRSGASWLGCGDAVRRGAGAIGAGDRPYISGGRRAGHAGLWRRLRSRARAGLVLAARMGRRGRSEERGAGVDD